MKLSPISLLSLLAIGSLAALVSAASLGAKQVEIVQHDLRLSQASQPLRLIQISDLHLTAFGPHEQELARRVFALNADVVVLSGDAIERTDALAWLASFVQALSPVPVLLVPGNWEHWSGLDFTLMQSALAASGAQLVLNDQWTLSRGGRTLRVLGLDDFTAGQPDLQILHSDEARPGEVRVVVQHSPAFFDETTVVKRMATKKFDLCLSGHTHGGQIAIGNWAPVRPPGSGRFVAGFYDVTGCPLFVSRGAGTSVLPFRLGAPAEVVVFDL
jgi:hypothetical protein